MGSAHAAPDPEEGGPTSSCSRSELTGSVLKKVVLEPHLYDSCAVASVAGTVQDKSLLLNQSKMSLLYLVRSFKSEVFLWFSGNAEL